MLFTDFVLLQQNSQEIMSADMSCDMSCDKPSSSSLVSSGLRCPGRQRCFSVHSGRGPQTGGPGPRRGRGHGGHWRRGQSWSHHTQSVAYATPKGNVRSAWSGRSAEEVNHGWILVFLPLVKLQLWFIMWSLVHRVVLFAIIWCYSAVQVALTTAANVTQIWSLPVDDGRD